MTNRPKNKLDNDQPKLFGFERLSNGEKVMCIRKRIHGEKKEIKLTLKQIIEEFEKA